VWILYQIYKGIPDHFHSFPLDEGEGTWTTLNECSEILASIPSGAAHKDSVIQAFYRVLMHLNEHGRSHWIESEKKWSQWDIPERKKNLAWIGHKRPVQYSHPEIQSFLNNLFPKAHFIHLIRNPRFVVASMMKAAEVWPTQKKFRFRNTGRERLSKSLTDGLHTRNGCFKSNRVCPATYTRFVWRTW
jgi:hypothetical protein